MAFTSFTKKCIDACIFFKPAALGPLDRRPSSIVRRGPLWDSWLVVGCRSLVVSVASCKYSSLTQLIDTAH